MAVVCHIPCSLLSVAACCTVCYLLLRAVQFLFVATCRVNDQGSADACRTVSNYKKEISSQTSCTVCYLLLRAVQFLFVAACRVNDQGSADACRTVSNYKKK